MASTALLLIKSLTLLEPNAALPAPVVLSDTAAPRYTVVDLGMPKGAEWVSGYAASPDFRYIVGSARVGKIRRAFVWHDGKFKYLSQEDSAAYAINDKGKAVGTLFIDEDFWLWDAVIWEKNGKMQHLFPSEPKDDLASDAHAIDKRGTIYGTRNDADYIWRAFIRTTDGSTVYPDTTPKQDSSFADVNEKGQILMMLSTHKSSDERYVVWEKNKTRALPPLPGARRCQAHALNSAGVVVGTCWDAGGIPLPMIWKNNKPALIKLPDITSGYAVEISDRGDILVWAKTKTSSVERSFLIRRGICYELNTLIDVKVDIRHARHISSDGTILANGFAENEWRTFVLKPK